MEIKLKLPKEFIELCHYDQVEPVDVLQGFVADLCGLEAGDYCSHGSDERCLANDYYDRVGYRYLAQWRAEHELR